MNPFQPRDVGPPVRSQFSLLLGLFTLPLGAQEEPLPRPKAQADRTVLESITSESAEPTPSLLESALALLAEST